jgi:NADH-quinone oxidoreductase subunit A
VDATGSSEHSFFPRPILLADPCRQIARLPVAPQPQTDSGGAVTIIPGEGLFSPWTPGVFSLALFVALVVVMIGVLLYLSSWLGEKHRHPEKQRPYESGIIPTGSARLRYPVPFYLVAIFFLIFDVEGAYIFSWAVAAEDLGWRGWLQMTIFIVILLAGLVYIWRKGALDWGPSAKKRHSRP